MTARCDFLRYFDIHVSACQDDFLPVPIVSAQNTGTDTAQVIWHFQRSAEPLYRLLVNVVNIIGVKFQKDVNSDIRSVQMYFHLHCSKCVMCFV